MHCGNRRQLLGDFFFLTLNTNDYFIRELFANHFDIIKDTFNKILTILLCTSCMTNNFQDGDHHNENSIS